MSLTSALNAAKSGLAATSTRAEITSRNIANAETDGYVRKLGQAVTGLGGTVSIAKIDRQVDSMLNALDRAGISSMASASARADGMAAYTDVLGQPNAEGSPAYYLGALQASLVTLSADPSSRTAQNASVLAAKALTGNLHGLSGAIAEVQSEVEASIKLDVADLNTALQTVAGLNRQISRSDTGAATADQMDRLDRALDVIAGFMDVQIARDARGNTTVHTAGGTELVIGDQAVPVRYDAAAGTLSAGGQDITPGQVNRGFSEGSLAGLFDLRNNVLPGWSAELDTVAAGLVEASGRLAELAPGSGLGLFTDAGLVYDDANRKGLAARIQVNAAVDPDLGGDAGLLQSGGDPTRPIGDLSLIAGLQSALRDKPQISGAGSALGLSEYITSVVAGQHGQRADAEAAQSRVAAAASTISASRSNIQSVDVDEELQSLLAIQQAYSANARIISVVSGMLDDLIAAV